MKMTMIAAVVLGSLSAHAAVAGEAIPQQTLNEALRARLPQDLVTAGKMVAVNSGSFPLTKSLTGQTCRARAPICQKHLVSFSASGSNMQRLADCPPC